MTKSQHLTEANPASTPLFSIVTAHLDQLHNSKDQVQLFKTGFPGFDEKFGGLGCGELVVVGGRPGMGKTQLLVQLTLELSKTVPVLFFTYDLSSFHLSQRFMSAVSALSVNQIIYGQLSAEQRSKLSQDALQLSAHQILLNETAHSSMEDFKALCKQHVEADKVKVVVIDYLQLLSERKTRQNRDAELSFITRELKNLAKDLQICIVASSQLSRSLETRGGDRKPLLSDLRESGAIEQNADKVLFIYRPEYYGFMQDEYGNSTQGLVELIVAKNRTGHLGSIYFKRNATLSAYEPYDEPQHQFNFSPNRLDELKENTDPSPPF
jgi:replicative DNA helicase